MPPSHSTTNADRICRQCTLKALGWLAIAALWVNMSGAANSQEAALSEKGIANLQQALANDYSYRDLRGINWEERMKQFAPNLKSAKDSREFAKIASEYLREANDIHIWLKVGDQVIPTYQHNQKANINPRLLPGLTTSLKQHGKTVLTANLKDQVRYVLIGTWEKREPQSMEAAIEAVREAVKSKSPLIIDVRPNTGGDELLARKVASLFVQKPTNYAAHIPYTSGKDGPMQKRVLEPDPEGLLHTAPCVVLMGPVNMSSCESFLLMMRSAGIKLIGAKSLGTSGNPKPRDLGNGVTVFLPSWKSLDANGNNIEGVGIEPDIVVPVGDDELTKSDPILKKALEVLAP